jgi:Ca-activated chloride channel family protein
MPPGKAAEIAAKQHIKIHTIAIGNPKARGEDKVDEPLMKSISATTGGRYFLGQDEKQLATAYATLDEIAPQNFKTQSYRPKRQLFLYPLAAAVLLLLSYHVIMFLTTSFSGWLHRLRRLESVPEGENP